ncbi:MAG: MBL fold metallo-hydrolase [Jatrophihabitans sp.]|uniref:MBL fold metallo-hydrolase n=1 Tax=Jatrophihabitans sp. TaxID=1932789 RepID=UPI003F7D587E
MADDCTLTFLGTATTLLRLGPFTVLTDPNFLHRGQFAYLGHGLVSRRLTEPAMAVDDLPDLDAVVLSHMHGDHRDRVAKRGLPKHLPVLTTPKAARALHRQGFRGGRGLTTWQTHTLSRDGARLVVTALPGRHAKGVTRHLLPPVMGSLLEYAPAGEVELRVNLTGDTMVVDDLREIPRRYASIDAAVLHLGGTTLPNGAMVTMDGREGTDLVELVRPGIAVPVHHTTTGSSDHRCRTSSTR